MPGVEYYSRGMLPQSLGAPEGARQLWSERKVGGASEMETPRCSTQLRREAEGGFAGAPERRVCRRVDNQYYKGGMLRDISRPRRGSWRGVEQSVWSQGASGLWESPSRFLRPSLSSLGLTKGGRGAQRNDQLAALRGRVSVGPAGELEREAEPRGRDQYTGVIRIGTMSLEKDIKAEKRSRLVGGVAAHDEKRKKKKKTGGWRLVRGGQREKG